MGQGDFSIKVTADWSEYLNSFKAAESQARQSGERIGSYLDSGVKKFSTTTLAGLQAELNRLQQRQLVVAVNTKQFDLLGQKIAEIQTKVGDVQRKQLTIGVDDRSIVALQSRLQDLQTRQVKVNVNGQEFVDLQRQINAVAQQFTAIERKRLLISVDDKSITALQSKLQELQNKQTKLNVDSSQFRALQTEIDKVQAEIAETERKKLVINVNSNSVTAITTRLQSELDRLQQRQLKIDVDSTEFKSLGNQINATQSKLNELQQRRTLVNIDPGSIVALRSKLGELQGDLEKVAIGSQRFKELQLEIRKTEAELGKASESSGDLHSILGGLSTAIAAIGVGVGLTNFVKESYNAALAADAVTIRLSALGDKFGETDKIQSIVSDSARLLNISTTDASESFLRLYGALRPTGVQLGDIKTVFTATNAAAKNFGLSSNSLNATILQLTQGLASGRLQGDELRSIMEQMPPISQAIAKEMNITVGEVKKFGSEGKITSDIVIQAIKNMNQAELGKLKTSLTSAQERINAQEIAWKTLSKEIGRNFVQAALPFINISTKIASSLTSVVKAANSAPSEIKALIAVIGGLPTAYAAARVAIAAMNTEIVRTQWTATAKSVTALGDLLKTKWAADSAAAKTAWVAFTQSLSSGGLIAGVRQSLADLAKDNRTTLAGSFNTVKTSVAGFTQALASGEILTNLKGIASAAKTAMIDGVKQAILGAASALTSFTLALTSGTITSSLAKLAKDAVIALGPFAAAVAGVTLAWKSYEASVAGSNDVIDGAADIQDRIAASMQRAGIQTTDLTTLGGPFARAWQKASTAIGDFASNIAKIPSIGPAISSVISGINNALNSLFTGQSWKDASITQGLDQINTRTLNLKNQMTKTANAAGALYKEIIQNGGQATQSQVDQAVKTVAALNTQITGAQQTAAQYKKLAAAKRAAGRTEEADLLEKEAGLLQQDIAFQQARVTELTRVEGVKQRVTTASQASKTATDAEIQAVKDLAKAEAALNTVLEEAPVRNLADQITVGQQLQSLIGAIGQQEQSRYSVTRSQLDYELTKAKERGASENTINTIKRKIDTLDANALSARYKALQLEQTLQLALLQLTQQKAMAEANIEVLNARKTALQAEEKISKATNADDRRTAQAEKTLAEAMVGIAIQKRDLLIKTQPIERAIAAANDETADNAERAKAAAMGYQISADGSLTKVKGLATEIGKVNTLTAGSAREVDTYKRLAAAAGLNVSQAKDGTVVLGQRWEDVNTEVMNLNANIDGASGKTGAVKSGADGIKSALQQALGPAAGVVDAFVSAGEEAPGAVTAAKGFSSSLSVAAQASSAIKSIKLDTYMSNISSSTGTAALAAQNFYGWLQKAASLPVARWTGGPVEGGETYRVNELGQEALLSGGRLSLINAPSGGMWRAPSSGVVVPAGITAELQARGALPVRAARLTGGGSAIAEQAAVGAQQAVVLGKLEAAVDRLSRKDWNVNVTMRQGPTGSQVIKHLNRLL